MKKNIFLATWKKQIQKQNNYFYIVSKVKTRIDGQKHETQMFLLLYLLILM